MRPFIKLLCALALAATALCCAALAEVRVDAEMGYENAVTYLAEMPLRVHLINDGADADLTVAVSLTRSSYEFDRYEYPVTLAGGAEMRLTLPVKITFKQPAYTVEVLSGGQVIAAAEVKPQKTVSPDTLLVGLLSDQPQALRTLNLSAANDPLMRGENWQTLALSADTFPETLGMLRAFSMLAVDGFDVTLLSQQQRAALSQWLREGGIVLLGGGPGAAAAYRGFAAFTGITAGQPWQETHIDRALTAALAQGSFALQAAPMSGSATLLCALDGAAHPLAAVDGKTILDRCAVGQGVVYTCAFSLSERPLSQWEGMNGYWQRMLLTADQGLYLRLIRRLQNYYDTYGSNLYVDSWLLRQLPLDNPDPMGLVVALVAFFTVLTGIGSYWILKRVVGKREWMWFTVPALSLVSAVLTLLISSGMRMGKPALAAYAVTQVDENGMADTTILAGVAASARQPLRVSALNGETLQPENSNYTYFIDDDEQAEHAQPRLRYTYTYGDPMSLTLPQDSAWQVRTLYIEPGQQPECPVSAAIWWQQDGLHGEIVNNSAYTLSPGYVLTSLGYVTVPELLPGARHSFAIVENPSRKSDPNIEQVYEGELAQGNYVSIYTVIEAAVWPEYHGSDRESSDPERLRLRSLIDACRNSWGDFNVFRYVTFCDHLAQPALSVNGAPVERIACVNVVDVKFNYRAVGEGGIVKLTRGMIPAYSCDVDRDLTPRSSGLPLEDYAYFNLRDEPAICFALGEIAGLDLQAVRLDQATLSCESYGAQPRVRLYDASASQWVELQYSGFPAKIDADLLQRCLDGQGRLYVRFAPGVGGANSELYSPALTLEGRVQ